MIGSLLVSGRAVTAYIDPASTSYIIQIAVGAVIAIGTFLGVYRNKIKRFFRKKSGTGEEGRNVEKIEHGRDSEKTTVTAADLLDDDR